MTDLSALKRLVAYYSRHHLEPEMFDEIGGEAAFIDDAANLIQDHMPTADIERIRPYLIDGNVNEWIPLGQAIDEALNPAEGFCKDNPYGGYRHQITDGSCDCCGAKNFN